MCGTESISPTYHPCNDLQHFLCEKCVIYAEDYYFLNSTSIKPSVPIFKPGCWTVALWDWPVGMNDIIQKRQTCFMNLTICYSPAAVVFTVHQRALLLPYGDHPLPVLVLLFVHVNVSSCHVLDGCDVAAPSAHDPRHDRGRH